MRELTDQMGRKVALPARPKRIVSLCPSTTETLFALGAGERVVGRTEYCVHPRSEVETVAAVGGTKRVKLDRVAELDPDLVISVREENVVEQVRQFEERWPVYVLDPVDVETAIDSIELLGEAIAAEDEATRLTRQIRDAFADLPSADGVPVAYLIWRKPYMVVGAGTYIDDLLTRLGLRNVAHVLDDRYPVFHPEDAARLRPTLLLASSEPFPFTEKYIDELRALGGEPVIVDGEYFGWHGARMLEAAQYFTHLVPRLREAATLPESS